MSANLMSTNSVEKCQISTHGRQDMRKNDSQLEKEK